MSSSIGNAKFDLKDLGNNEHYTTIHITVEIKKHLNTKQFYHIKYEYTYSENNTNRYGDPFSIKDEHRYGEIIVVNELSTILIKYLLMDMEELNQFSGNVSPQDYKINIIRAITNFWD